MDKRESLTNRFKRVLGRSPPNSADEESNNERTEPKASFSRRREQVLHAQRTHRHRTQQYIRELEKEVFKLRDENEDLRRMIERLRGQNGVAGNHFGRTADDDVDHDWQHESHPMQQQLSPSLHFSSSSASSVTVDLTHFADNPPLAASDGRPVEIVAPVYVPQLPHASSSKSSPHGSSQHSSPPAVQIGEPIQLTPQMGITFILTLEQPCLPHIKYAHMGQSAPAIPEDIDYNSGQYHALTVSAGLTARYQQAASPPAAAHYPALAHVHPHPHVHPPPYLPTGSREYELGTELGWGQADLQHTTVQVPTEEIERLLAASGRLKLEYEITPVQIWARIMEIHRARMTGQGNTGEAIDVPKLQRLMHELAKYIYCNSFGAVVEKHTADAVLADVLGGDVFGQADRRVEVLA